MNAKYKNKQKFQAYNQGVSHVTVKGSGQEIGLDRPGPSQQLVYNWVMVSIIITFICLVLVPNTF